MPHGPPGAGGLPRHTYYERVTAHTSGIHKDTLRRIFAGESVPTITEAHAILEASGAAENSLLALFILGPRDRAVSWRDEPIVRFLSKLLVELPPALERVLGNQLSELRPRWAKGSAHRLARLLSDHINAFEKRDDLYLSNP